MIWDQTEELRRGEYPKTLSAFANTEGEIMYMGIVTTYFERYYNHGVCVNDYICTFV